MGRKPQNLPCTQVLPLLAGLFAVGAFFHVQGALLLVVSLFHATVSSFELSVDDMAEITQKRQMTGEQT